MQPSRPTWTQIVIEKWIGWRNRYHFGHADISRYDICVLLDEIRRMERKPVKLELERVTLVLDLKDGGSLVIPITGDGAGDE